MILEEENKCVGERGSGPMLLASEVDGKKLDLKPSYFHTNLVNFIMDPSIYVSFSYNQGVNREF